MDKNDSAVAEVPTFKVARVGQDRKRRKGGILSFFRKAPTGKGGWTGATGGSGAGGVAGSGGMAGSAVSTAAMFGKTAMAILITAVLGSGAAFVGVKLGASSKNRPAKPRTFEAKAPVKMEGDIANLPSSKNTIPNSLGYLTNKEAAADKARREAEEAARKAAEEEAAAAAAAAAQPPAAEQAAAAGAPAGGGSNFAKKFGALSTGGGSSSLSGGGGLGLAGFKIFGPGEADKSGGGNISLFQPRPKVEAPSEVAAVAADGSSASLNFAAAAAAKDREADAASATPTDQTAGAAASDPAKDAAAADAAKAAAAAANAPINAGSGGPAANGSMGHLQGTKKLGTLSGAGGASGSSSASASTKNLGDVMAGATRNGATSAFSRSQGGAAKASNNAGRGIASRRGSGARNQLASVLRDQRGAGSSLAAGRTYDGGGTSGGNSIGAENAIGSDGVGSGDSVQPKELGANRVASTREEERIPEPPAKNVTPWETQIMMGMAAGAIAVALMMYASSLMKGAKTAYLQAIMAAPSATIGAPAAIAAAELALQTAMTMIRFLIGVAIGAAVIGVGIGAWIASGEFGQTLQGGLLIASNALIATAGIMLMESTSMKGLPTDPKTIGADKTFAAFATPGPWIMAIGGAGAVGLVATMMTPKKTCKSTEDGCEAFHQQRSKPAYYSHAPAQDYGRWRV